ncbi:hypothetical protein GL035_21715 [Salmonella enterica]|nr:hypothetical protein [Salmonella enterica subsp. enterica serovar Kentucky]
MSIKNDGHYFCRAGGNRPDGLNEPVTLYEAVANLIFPHARETLPTGDNIINPSAAIPIPSLVTPLVCNLAELAVFKLAVNIFAGLNGRLSRLLLVSSIMRLHNSHVNNPSGSVSVTGFNG